MNDRMDYNGNKNSLFSCFLCVNWYNFKNMYIKSEPNWNGGGGGDVTKHKVSQGTCFQCLRYFCLCIKKRNLRN